MDNILDHETDGVKEQNHLGLKMVLKILIKVMQRHNKSKIKIHNDANGVATNVVEIRNILIRHFQDIFTSSNPNNTKESNQVVQGRIIDNLKNLLGMEFPEEEINQDIKNMKPNGIFYQKFWNLKKEVYTRL